MYRFIGREKKHFEIGELWSPNWKKAFRMPGCCSCRVGSSKESERERDWQGKECSSEIVWASWIFRTAPLWSKRSSEPVRLESDFWGRFLRIWIAFSVFQSLHSKNSVKIAWICSLLPLSLSLSLSKEEDRNSNSCWSFANPAVFERFRLNILKKLKVC